MLPPRVILHRRISRYSRRPPLDRRRGKGPISLILLIFNLIILSALGCTTSVASAGVVAAQTFAQVTRDLPDPDTIGAQPIPQVTQIYDRTGQHLLYEFYDERRINVPLSEVAPVMQQATLAIEDANFYQHRGFDPRSIARALWANVRHGETVSGASTITQQLVKRLLLSDEQTYIRKAREIVLAAQVEMLYPKDQILEMYLNHVYYGNQAYGVEAAALSYFGKSARDLDLAEASLLAGLVQLPSMYDPVRDPQAALERQWLVLEQMVKLGHASEEEAAAAAERARGFTYRMQESRVRFPHFAFYAKERLLQKLGPEQVRLGLRVITTLDVQMQERGEEIVRRRVDEIRWQHVNNGSLVALDPRTGEILAMVGSYDYYLEWIDGKVNVATAQRQPGSSFKPFTYATAFATRKFHPASQVIDEPISRQDFGSPGGFYRPVNYDGGWHGTVTLRGALANSYNIPAVLLQDAVGTPNLITTARKLGITTDLPAVPSLTLGAGTVKLLEMTGAYGVFANQGQRLDVDPFLEVTDHEGKVLHRLDPRPDREMWPQTAYLVNDVLSDRAARRPAFGNVLDLAANRTAAVKTGTTNDYKDSWTLGYTPSLVVGVWVGNTDNSPMLQVAGSLGAGYIWKDFMDATLLGYPDEPFPVPPDMVWSPVCDSRPEVEVFHGHPPGECPSILRAAQDWKAGPPLPAPRFPIQNWR
ncbi:MAG TPA: PBP1A family penicillin-binding protein [Chloroflexota bacterium]|nr:PBP1A family penicillin-binding protein [Chloroflexota bacterium]